MPILRLEAGVNGTRMRANNKDTKYRLNTIKTSCSCFDPDKLQMPFHNFLDRISRSIQVEEGVGFSGLRISFLLFADDVVLWASSSQDFLLALECFASQCQTAGNRQSVQFLVGEVRGEWSWRLTD